MAKVKDTKNFYNEEETYEEDFEAEKKKLEERNWKPLIDQIEIEYQAAYDTMKPKWDEWEIRLKLYNNQKRDKEAIGDPLIFTIHQSVLASLYSDTLISTFEAREEGDRQRVEQLNPMVEFDYTEMEKDVLDYEWDWDALFFGCGYNLLYRFSEKWNVPLPQILDPMTVLVDPWATSIQGKGKENEGAAQYLGWAGTVTRRQLKGNKNYFNVKGLKEPSSDDPRSLIDRNHEARNQAQGKETGKITKYTLTGDNKRFKVLNWFTWFKGELVFVTLAEDRNKVIQFKKIKERDTIPVVERSLFPTSHELHGISIPDLLEDKQRARSVLQNLSLKVAKLGLNPRMIYNSNMIKNKRDLDIEFNKHIAVEGNPRGVIEPLQTPTVKQEVQFILELLDSASQRATATPEQQQGIPSSKQRTLGELQILDDKVDTRYSLAARVFGWSEKRFWREWYWMYKQYLGDKIDEKAIRIYGAAGPTWKKLTRENIIATVDPDVKVESKSVSDQERFQELGLFREYLLAIAQDPEANIRFGFKELGRLSGIKQDRIDLLLPQNVQEMQAEAENEMLADDTKVIVLPSDDDVTHIIKHNQAPETSAKVAHINAHKRARLLKQNRPDLFGPEGTQGSTVNPTGGAGINGMTGISQGGSSPDARQFRRPNENQELGQETGVPTPNQANE